MPLLMKLIGALGLALISIGILSKKRLHQDELYFFGGIFLEIYSIWLGDIVFIVLQVIFTASAAYDIWRLRNQKWWYRLLS